MTCPEKMLFGQVVIRAGDWTTKTITFEHGQGEVTVFCDQITSVFDKSEPSDECTVRTSCGGEFTVPMSRIELLNHIHK